MRERFEQVGDRLVAPASQCRIQRINADGGALIGEVDENHILGTLGGDEMQHMLAEITMRIDKDKTALFHRLAGDMFHARAFTFARLASNEGVQCEKVRSKREGKAVSC